MDSDSLNLGLGDVRNVFKILNLRTHFTSPFVLQGRWVMWETSSPTVELMPKGSKIHPKNQNSGNKNPGIILKPCIPLNTLVFCLLDHGNNRGQANLTKCLCKISALTDPVDKTSTYREICVATRTFSCRTY